MHPFRPARPRNPFPRHLAIVDSGLADPPDPDHSQHPTPAQRWPSTLDDLIESVGSPGALEVLDAEPLPDEPFDWTAIAPADRSFVAEVLASSDRCCDELLDAEFRTITRRILALVAVRNPRSLRRSPNAARFAAGLVWLAGRANGEFGRGHRWRSDSLWCWFDVSPCSDRAHSIRKDADLIPEPRTWAPDFDRDDTIKLGDARLLHSRTRAQLIRRRGIAEEFERTHPRWSPREDGHSARVQTIPARPMVVGKGFLANTTRVQVLLGLGDDLDTADFFSLTIPDAFDLLHRLEQALDDPIPGLDPFTA